MYNRNLQNEQFEILNFEKNCEGLKKQIRENPQYIIYSIDRQRGKNA